ncbi:hypothetical protein LTR08_004099 [Meristemomyces frigidus]|nr:hypothetical protein LTR08_004099 [Meristemomyces frigidus]
MIECVREDLRDIQTFYCCSISSTRRQRLKNYFQGKLGELHALPYEDLSPEDQTDYVLALAPLIEPFASKLVALIERRQRVAPTTGKYAADLLSAACSDVREKGTEIECGRLGMDGRKSRFAAYRAVNVLGELKYRLSEWFGFYDGYDPAFTWWTKRPHEELLVELQQLIQTVRKEIIGVGKENDDNIVGQPVGREGLLADLDAEFIAYSPEELIEIADRETIYVEPGQQPYLVHELAEEAIAYVKKTRHVSSPRPFWIEGWAF